MTRLTVCLFAVFLLLPSAAYAETDLKQALAAAYEKNPTLQASRAELRAVDEDIAQALAGWRPDISTGGDYSYTEVDPDSFGSGAGETKTLQLGVTQPLYRGGRTLAETREAENRILAQRAVLHTTEQTVLLHAAIAFMDVLRDQKILELEKKNEAVLTRHLEAARDRFDVGEVTRTDVSQAESRLAAARANRINAEGNLRTSAAVYEQIIGTAPAHLRQPGFDVLLPSSLEQAVAQAETGNPDVVIAEYGEKAALAQIRAVEGELLPEINATGTVNRVYNPRFGGIDKQDTGTLSIGATIPLYKSGAVRSRVRQAKEEANQRQIEIESARRAARQQAISAWEQFESARAEIESRKSQVEAAALALEGVEQEALFGSRTVLDALDAEQEALDARVRLVIAERNKVVAAFTLLAATGQLTPDTLALEVERYNPASHYNKTRRDWFGLDTD